MKRQKLIVLSVMLLMFINPQMRANAEQNIKTLSAPIPFTINNELSLDKIEIGSEVVLVVPDDIVYKKSTLKKDTALIGTVVKFKKSKRYYKNGYFEILVHSINYPDKNIIVLKKPLDIKLYNPEIMVRKNKPAWMKVSEAVFFCSDNVIPGTSLPLYIYETFKWDKSLKDKSRRYKWGIILSKTTTVYYYADFVVKHADPNYKEGDIVNIKLKKKASKELF